MKRRDFLKYSGLGAVGSLAGVSFSGLAQAKLSNAKGRVVVVGGGFGGTIAAKYLRRWSEQLDITLIERDATYYTCPYSNLVLSGERELDSIGFTYDALAKNHNIKVVNSEVTGVDTDRQVVRTGDGDTIEYDRLILSPGISLRYDMVEGYDETQVEKVPHAWKAGSQTTTLRKQLEAMPDGGLFLMVAPPNPYRCPPGPPERASQVASYFQRHKPKSKVMIIDFKNAFSKQGLFQGGWQHFGYNIEWVRLADWSTSIDSKGAFQDFVVYPDEMRLVAGFEEIEADVINMIPPQRAGAVADMAGTTDDSGWCPVDQRTFASTQVDNVYVIGDAALAGAMPKSGYAANSQAKICASAVAAALADADQPKASFTNTCYSHVGPRYGISVAMVYTYDENDKIVGVSGAGGVSPSSAPADVRKLEAIYADGWYNAIVKDMFT